MESDKTLELNIWHVVQVSGEHGNRDAFFSDT